ncbi:MAG TPA: hypothetical protein VGG06_05605 [Thermoanaerobaculia bacterium]
MSRRRLLAATALLCAIVLIAAPAWAGPNHGRATRHDVSPPLSEMALPLPAKSGLQVEVNPIQPPARTPGPGAAPGFQDPSLQTSGEPRPGAAPTPAPSLVFEGLSDDDNAAIVGGRVVPPDTEGDVGLDHYVQWNNLILAIYDKDTGAIVAGGGPFAGNSLWSGFGGVCETTNNGDPIVLYDHLAGRWFLSQFAINFGVQCVAVSQTGDPRGPYDRWEFEVSPNQNNDYPKFGLMPESYVLTLRDFPSSVPFFASAVLFDRKAMLAGDAAPRFVKDGLTCGALDCVDGWQPPHLEGPPPPGGTPVVLTKVWDDDFDGPVTGCDGVRLWQFDVDWNVNPPATAFFSLGTACGAGFDNDMCGFFNRNCIPQATVSQLLDPIDELQMYRAQYRHAATHDTLMVNTTVDAGGDRAGQHWIELRNSGLGWAIHQQGTYAPADGLHRWMGSIAKDGDGNIALGFSTSSATTFPSIAYNTKMAADPADGVLSGGEVVMHAGTGSQTGANRWGDYSTMSVDPVDDCTFFYTQEYYQTTGSFDFNTKVGAFTLADCNTDRCGNGFCQPGESCAGGGGPIECDADCLIETGGGGGTPGVCGNGVCEPAFGEDCLSCAGDCRGQQNGKPANRFCCGDGDGQNPIVCSDGDGSICNQGGFVCGTFSGGGGTVCCGDGVCDSASGECDVCERDCSRDAACGDGGGGGCVPTHSNEKGPRCSDGLDNDCDGLIDGADPDC